jgi:glycosyltransferase involved in cell wall biosynthesis
MRALNLCAPQYNPADSYGRIADELSRGLQACGWHVNELCPSPGQARQTLLRWTESGLFLGPPYQYQWYKASTLKGAPIAITMFESTRLPDGWVEPLNKKMAAVIVPSTFLVDVFRMNGVKIPIHVVPLGISPTFHQQKARVWTCSEDEPFTVLVIGDRGLRKNWHGAAFAFQKAFGDDMRYRLIIKARPDGLNFGITNPNIEVIREDYTDEQMLALYHRCHVMLFPTHGEGFGFPPREFAASGGIALATDWGGTADDIAHWGVPLPCRIEEAWQGRFNCDLGQWAAITTEALVLHLKDVAADYAWYLKTYQYAPQFVTQAYRWDRFASEVSRIYKLYN